MTSSSSSVSADGRTLERIIYEKAAMGAMPTFFNIHGDHRNHPVQFVKHPHLNAIMFSDGTTIHVEAYTSADIEAVVGPIHKPSDVAWATEAERDIIETYAAEDAEVTRSTADALNDLSSALEDGYAEAILGTAKTEDDETQGDLDKQATQRLEAEAHWATQSVFGKKE